MIERRRGEIIFRCDNCDEGLETEEEDFPTALAIFRREHWKAEQIGGREWVHSCPACRGDGGYHGVN